MGAGDQQTVDMSEQEQAEIRLEFARLKQEHADFDAAINAMIAMACDPLQVQRMKKKKLAMKDRLKALEDQNHTRYHRLNRTEHYRREQPLTRLPGATSCYRICLRSQCAASLRQEQISVNRPTPPYPGKLP